MKSVKKIFAELTAIALLSLSFMGCPGLQNNPEENPGTSQTEQEFTVLTDGSEITVNVGEEKTFKVENADGFSVAENYETTATIANNGDGTFTIKGVADGTLSIIFQNSSDEDGIYDKTVTLYVYNPNYNLTVSLDDTLKALAANASFKYGYSNANGTALTEYETLTATFTDGTANFALKKSLSGKDTTDAWKGWNNCVLTLLDSEGTEISSSYSYQAWLSYDSADSSYLSTLNVIAVSQSLEFTINFTGFTAESVSGLIYTNTDGDFDITGENAISAEVSVSEDGTSATFDVEKSKTNSTGYFQVNFASITIKDTDGNTVSPTSGNTNAWFEYKEGMNATIAVVNASGAKTILEATNIPSAVSSSSVTELVAASFMPESASSIIITYTVGENDILTADTSWISVCSDSSWTNVTKIVDAWASGFSTETTAFTATITDSSVISAFISGGIYIAANSADYTGTISVSYTE